MAEQKMTYRVKPGFTHGARKQYQAGDTVELTEQEAASFLDKLELVDESRPLTPVSGLQVTAAELAKVNVTPPVDPNTPPPPFDVVNANIDEVLAAVKEGKITASAALIAEQQGSKKRASLLGELTKLAEAESQVDGKGES